jgi:hypothetical protein
MNFCVHVPNSLRNKNLKRLIANPKWLIPSNAMISQMVRNEYLRFGVYVDIQVSYKILWLEIPKEVLVLHQPLSRGVVLR